MEFTCATGDLPSDDQETEEQQKIKYLPPEVMEKIIKHCEAPVLLQLRLVCPTMKTLVDTSARFQELLNNLEVNLHVSTLEEFVTSAPSLPFTRFSIDLCPATEAECPFDLNYLDIDFYPEHRGRGNHLPTFYVDSPHLQTFQQKFCPNIRRLRLCAFYCGTTDAELDFLKSLKVLEELDIRVLRLLTRKNSKAGPSLEVKSPRIPSLPALKRLRFRLTEYPPHLTCQDYLTDWIASCPSLVHLRLPLDYDASNILQLGSKGHLPNLRSLDMNFGHFGIHQCSPEDLHFLGKLTSRGDFRLEGVSARVLSRVTNAPRVPPEVKRAFFSCVAISEVHLEPLGDLENLEELEFHSDLRSYNSGVEPQDGEMRANEGILRLASLKKITAKVLPVEFVAKEDAEVFQHLVNRMFRPAHPRLSVTHLDIAYLDLRAQGSHCQNRFPPTFTPEHVHLGFPNLKKFKLTLSGCPLPSFAIDRMVDLIDVLSEKPFLEELHLSIHDGIPEAAFTGRNPRGLLRLQHLRKFRLDIPSQRKETAERMGDGTLGVLSQMTLTHLHISGGVWTNVTGDGLRTLSEGPLGRTILWTQLNDVGASLEAEERREVFEGLSRVCHSNRFARGLTSVSFHQFQTSEAAVLRTQHPFRRGGWTDQEFGL